MYLFNNYEMDNSVFYGVAGQNLYKSLKIDFILANSTDPNEMPLKLDLHCLSVFIMKWVKVNVQIARCLKELDFGQFVNN